MLQGVHIYKLVFFCVHSLFVLDEIVSQNVSKCPRHIFGRRKPQECLFFHFFTKPTFKNSNLLKLLRNLGNYISFLSRPKYVKFWIISQGNFFQYIPLISEECVCVCAVTTSWMHLEIKINHVLQQWNVKVDKYEL